MHWRRHARRSATNRRSSESRTIIRQPTRHCAHSHLHIHSYTTMIVVSSYSIATLFGTHAYAYSHTPSSSDGISNFRAKTKKPPQHEQPGGRKRKQNGTIIYTFLPFVFLSFFCSSFLFPWLFSLFVCCADQQSQRLEKSGPKGKERPKRRKAKEKQLWRGRKKQAITKANERVRRRVCGEERIVSPPR